MHTYIKSTYIPASISIATHISPFLCVFNSKCVCMYHLNDGLSSTSFGSFEGVFDLKMYYRILSLMCL